MILYEDNTATKSNLKLILSTELKSLFADPEYGCGLKKFLFEQNSPIVHDLIIDKIYDFDTNAYIYISNRL